MMFLHDFLVCFFPPASSWFGFFWGVTLTDWRNPISVFQSADFLARVYLQVSYFPLVARTFNLAAEYAAFTPIALFFS